MAVTTLAETIGEISLIQYLANRPRTPSIMPPMSTAPIIAPYPYCAPTKLRIDTKVKLMPMTMGRPEPILPNSGNSCTSVPMPAMSMAL